LIEILIIICELLDWIGLVYVDIYELWCV